MDKNIKEYQKFIKSEIEKIKDESNNKIGTKTYQDNIIKLYQFHQNNIKNFQHERLIHLIVTVFFAGLLLFFVSIPYFLSSLSTSGNDYSILISSTSIISVVILITEIFYIRYYYQLENGTQNLYKYSKILYELMK